jgi:hypothetical protein
MKEVAERSLVMPKSPVKNSDAETLVNPADIKMVGASRKYEHKKGPLQEAQRTYNNLVR